MKASIGFLTASLFANIAHATVVWSGSFDGYATAATFDNWSWANQVGAYQWYIHGSQPTSTYLDVSPSYKNPAVTSETKGLKLTIDSTSTWNSAFWRTELIPQTTSNIGTGQQYYHFSVKRTDVNPPRSTYEHQVLFFESHFTEFKYGVGSNPTDLQWFVSGTSKWSTAFNANVWYNFAYDINFTAGTVGLWASTGSSPLVKVVENIVASTYSNSADWHLGVLAFATGTAPEDWYFSCVYVESGTISTSVASCGTGGAPSSTTATTLTATSASTFTTTSKSTTSVTSVSSTSTMATTTTSASGATQTHYGQCGGTGYTGPTVCASPYTCTSISPPFYYQCL